MHSHRAQHTQPPPQWLGQSCGIATSHVTVVRLTKYTALSDLSSASTKPLNSSLLLCAVSSDILKKRLNMFIGLSIPVPFGQGVLSSRRDLYVPWNKSSRLTSNIHDMVEVTTFLNPFHPIRLLGRPRFWC